MPLDVQLKIFIALRQAVSDGISEEFGYELTIGDDVLAFAGRLVQQIDDRYLAVIRDITKSKRNEKALIALTSQLTLAEEAQRRELAILLHDGLGQEISGALYSLQALLAREEPVAPKALQRIRAMLALNGSSGTSLTCTTFVPRSTVVNTNPSAVAPAAIGASRNPRLRKSASIRPFDSQAVTSFSGASSSTGRNSQPKAPNAESRLAIEKWFTPAASSGVK